MVSGGPSKADAEAFYADRLLKEINDVIPSISCEPNCPERVTVVTVVEDAVSITPHYFDGSGSEVTLTDEQEYNIENGVLQPSHYGLHIGNWTIMGRIELEVEVFCLGADEILGLSATGSAGVEGTSRGCGLASQESGRVSSLSYRADTQDAAHKDARKKSERKVKDRLEAFMAGKDCPRECPNKAFSYSHDTEIRDQLISGGRWEAIATIDYNHKLWCLADGQELIVVQQTAGEEPSESGESGGSASEDGGND